MAEPTADAAPASTAKRGSVMELVLVAIAAVVLAVLFKNIRTRAAR